MNVARICEPWGPRRRPRIPRPNQVNSGEGQMSEEPWAAGPTETWVGAMNASLFTREVGETGSR